MKNNILEVKNLKTSFYTHLGEVQAIRGISFTVSDGEILGIVGESGSGKSVTALSILQLLIYPGKIKEGNILFNGKDLLSLKDHEMRHIRGNEISMIFQDPMTSLNPVYTIGNQIDEVLKVHQSLTRLERKERTIELLELVGIPDPVKRRKCYPHEFSGGMRQRAMIAMALACEPQLLIADEPTTALDVTIQAQILNIMKKINKEKNNSTILITHDLGVVAETCDRVIVMYGGLIMEQGTIEHIFKNPSHPYTLGLLRSLPNIKRNNKEKLIPIKGTPPDLLYPPKGCPFAARCDKAMNICNHQLPDLFEIEENHRSLCWLNHPDYKASREEV
ncbi:MAG: transporter ATP-binding protein [Haloplasmataceae bacterium]|jgi:oligopeptide transport system ATP-binding protein|nr:transporter ATP-binding protein [Haloplasmataceae bacterium]